MSQRDKFEIDCEKFLLDQFGPRTRFAQQKAGVASLPDVEAVAKKHLQFYIRPKYPLAQCGQFSLSLNFNTAQFEYAENNFVELNEFSRKIIDGLNMSCSEFKETKRIGEAVSFENCRDAINGWILKSFKDNGVSYLVTNDYRILPIENLFDYFKISARYVIKREDSTSVGSENVNEVSQYLISEFPGDEVKIEGDKVFIFTERTLFRARLVIGRFGYMFTKRGNAFEVRRLSDRFFANVLFFMELKPNENINIISDIFFVLTPFTPKRKKLKKLQKINNKNAK